LLIDSKSEEKTDTYFEAISLKKKREEKKLLSSKHCRMKTSLSTWKDSSPMFSPMSSAYCSLYPVYCLAHSESVIDICWMNQLIEVHG
jgi:hypothetical protein